MKISVDTEQDSFTRAITAVHAAYGVTALGSETAASSPAGDGLLAGGWTRETLHRLAEWVGADESAIALRFIAEHAPAVGIDETIEHVKTKTTQPKFDGRAMGGKMSAIGKGRTRIGGGSLTGPHETDRTTRQYRMDEVVAAVLLEELVAVGKV